MNSFKKIFIAAATCLSMLIPFSLSASAELLDDILPRIVDNAELISQSEEQMLNDKINDIISKYDFDVVIVTENSIGDYSPMEYADDFYDYGGYGANSAGDGVLLLISMADRDWWISTKGYGITAFTDYGIDKAGEIITPDLSAADYDAAFEKFLSVTDEYLKEAKAGTPYDIDNKYMTSSDKTKTLLISIGIGLGIGLIAAIIVAFVLKSQLTFVKFEYAAKNYEVNGSFKLNRQNDVFLYRNVTKTRKAENSGGGSSTHRSSSGSSHGGGGGKF